MNTILVLIQRKNKEFNYKRIINRKVSNEFNIDYSLEKNEVEKFRLNPEKFYNEFPLDPIYA
jgi:hypothetical protein